MASTNPRDQEKEKPIVFVGAMEHHSNMLVWREYAEVISVPSLPCGRVDQARLQELLLLNRHRFLPRHVTLNRFARHHTNFLRATRIGCFSAASNVTGVCENIDEVTRLLHQHGALAFWDYAAAAPHGDINVSPATRTPDSALFEKDAVFIR